VPQLFHRRFGFFFRLGLLAVVMVAVGVILLWRSLTGYPGGLHEALEQPVPFSHKHHVADDGIDCRYCHSAVESSAFAGIPPLSTCMTCHSQLYTDQAALAPVVEALQSGIPLHWQRLYKLPDFVYFNHSIHVAKGVGCATCHGNVELMPLTAREAPLTMQWCLACHRRPEQYLRPRDKVFNLDWHAPDQLALGARLLQEYHIDKRRLADCSLCHR
jgi:hypothetical protein